MKQRPFLGLFVGCALATCIAVPGTSALAFKISKTQNGAEIKWKTTATEYVVNPSGGPSNALSAIRKAADTWSNVRSSSFTFFYSGSSGSTGHGTYDGTNLISFGKLNTSGALAENRFWYSPVSGEMLDSDIRFNTSYAYGTNGSPNAYDLQNIATHELGHSLSLDDLLEPGHGEKTMYGYSSMGETNKRSLHQDDMDGITQLYPTSLATVTVTAKTAYASESGKVGRFVISRTGDTGAALIVRYAIGGSATNGVDYERLSGSIRIPAGASSRVVRVVPVDDKVSEGRERVRLTLVGRSWYRVGSPNRAVLTIRDND